MNNTGFVAGTLIHTDKGLVPIQALKVGDMVHKYLLKFDLKFDDLG